MTDEFKEAVTIKSRVISAAKALHDLLADKTLPKAMRDGVEGLMSSMKKTWADLETDANSNASAAEAEIFRSAQNDMELIEGGAGIMPLMEKAVRRDNTIPIKIIQPGWGSSGYYPADVLERDGPKIFTKGTKMFWNHQTPAEEAERPEGDLNNLAAELVSDARYDRNGKAGAGLYADAKVFEGYKNPIDDLAAHIGVSIRAYGKAQHGQIEGREGAIITELTNKKSVDFVTAAGAGGEILSLFEAARTQPPSPTLPQNSEGLNLGEGRSAVDKKTTTVSVETNSVHKEARIMDDKDLQKLQESVTTLQTSLGAVQDENARLKEAMALREAKDLVSATLDKFQLPDVTRERLLESLPKSAPMKDGALDVETFRTKIAEAVKAESAYLSSVMGAGRIRGLGGSSNDDGEEFDEAKMQGELESAFSEIGLSESGAKIAAKGRS